MRRFKLVALLSALPLVAALVVSTAVQSGADEGPWVNRVTIPQADQFTPFALTIRAGDVVQWINRDTDNHTVVSDDAYNTTGPHFDRLIVGTDATGGRPGTLAIQFRHPGTFIYFCRFHSHLDANNQPVAPGPNGGIQDANGNFGTPMSGVITVRGSGDN